jgi:hypothetical protein
MNLYDSLAQELVQMLDKGLGGLGAPLLILVVTKSVSCTPRTIDPRQLTSLTSSECGTWVMVTARARGWVSGPPGMNAF